MVGLIGALVDMPDDDARALSTHLGGFLRRVDILCEAIGQRDLRKVLIVQVVFLASLQGRYCNSTSAADALNLPRETVRRLIRELEAEGVLRVHWGRVDVCEEWVPRLAKATRGFSRSVEHSARAAAALGGRKGSGGDVAKSVIASMLCLMSGVL